MYRLSTGAWLLQQLRNTCCLLASASSPTSCTFSTQRRITRSQDLDLSFPNELADPSSQKYTSFQPNRVIRCDGKLRSWQKKKRNTGYLLRSTDRFISFLPLSPPSLFLDLKRRTCNHPTPHRHRHPSFSGISPCPVPFPFPRSAAWAASALLYSVTACFLSFSVRALIPSRDQASLAL